MNKRVIFALFMLLVAAAAHAQAGAYPQAGGGQSVAPNTGILTIANTCAGQTNCLQGVDDDSTDNCGSALTSFMAAVNAYSGAGRPQVFIGGSGIGKAYKFATAGCHMAFLIPAEVHIWATLDAAQPATTTNLIQLGPTGLVALSAAQSPKYEIDGGGTIIGGANLSNAGIECEPFISNCMIDGLHWTNFGAGNATLGNCTNYAILYDANAAEGTVSRNEWVATDATAGRCAFGNPNGASTGQNTVYFVNNIIGGNAAGSACGSTGIVDGGSYGMSRDNNIFGMSIPIRIQGIGHRIDGNQLDTSTCAAHGVRSEIHVGAASSSTVVPDVTIVNNAAEFYTGAALDLLAVAGDSTATIQDFVVTGNQAVQGGISHTTGTLFPNTLACAPNSTSLTNCYVAYNLSLLANIPCGAVAGGWQFGTLLAACTDTAQAANDGSSGSPKLLITPGVIQGTRISCTVTQTQAPTTSGTLPSCVMTWTDFRSGAVQTVTMTPTYPSGSAAPAGCEGNSTSPPANGNQCQSTVGTIVPNAATNLGYYTTGYVSTGATPLQYTVYVTANVVQ